MIAKVGPANLWICAWCGSPIHPSIPLPEEPRPGPDFGRLCPTCQEDADAP